MLKRSATFSIRELAPLFFALFIDIMGFGLVYPILTALFTSGSSAFFPHGAGDQIRFLYMSLGFLLYPLCMFFGASFMGDLSDIYGRKRVLILCMLGLFIGYLLMAGGVLGGSLSLLLIGRGLCGIMSGSMPVALAAISDLSTPQNKAVHMSFVGLVQCLGFVLGPFLGGLLSDKKLVPFFNFSVPFFVTSVLALIAIPWLIFAFAETDTHQRKEKKIDFKRLFLVFVEASKHRAIRLLGLSFLFMQIGVALYVQLILIFYKNQFHYSSFEMGVFNAYLGLWFAVALLLVIPYAVRFLSPEWITFYSLIITAVAELLIAITANMWLLWILAIPFAMAVQTGFTTMLTSFSNAADENSQGWAMGITGSIIAIAFILTGLSPTLVPIIGVKILIFIGSLFMFLASALLLIYCKRVFSTSGK